MKYQLNIIYLTDLKRKSDMEHFIQAEQFYGHAMEADFCVEMNTK